MRATPHHPNRRARRGLLLALPALALAACAAPAATAPSADTAELTADAPEPHGHGEEVATAHPRLVTTYDGGLLVVDALTLELVADVPLTGFNRVAEAGDGRHVLVSHTADEPGWHVLDAGTWSEQHGDHAHHFVGEPRLTGDVVAAVEPAHVVRHAGRTVLFDDGTGTASALDPGTLVDGVGELTTYSSEAAHHGVAVVRGDGSLVQTVGTAESRTGVRVLDADGTEVARTEQCPGVHGEGVAADEVVVLGCEDGVVLVRGTEITKLTSPTPFGRIGNAYVAGDSPLVVGDYKHDPDQGLALTRLSLVDTQAATLSVVELPAGVSYTWRGVGRGPSGEAVVLSTDGTLSTYDPVTGEQRASWPVVAPWTAPEEWQEAHPALVVLDETAYVTEPATREVHAVDLVTGEVWATGTLPAAPNELVAVGG